MVGHFEQGVGHVHEGEAYERVLAHRQSLASGERGVGVGPRLVHEGAGSPEPALGLGEALLERGAVDLAARPTRLLLGHLGEFVEHAPPDAESPTRVALLGESDDADVVGGAAALGVLRHGEVRPTVGHVHVVERVVDRAGAAQAEHVPVVDQRGLLHRHDEDARLARALDDRERVDVGAVLEARGEAPRAGQAEAIAIGHGHARAGALAGDHGALAWCEQLGGGPVGEVGTGRADRETGGHHDPAGGGVAIGEVFEHLERVDRAQLGPAEDLGYPHREEPVTVQRLDDRLGDAPLFVGVGGVLVEHRYERTGPFGQRCAGRQPRPEARCSGVGRRRRDRRRGPRGRGLGCRRGRPRPRRRRRIGGCSRGCRRGRHGVPPGPGRP